MSRGYFRSRTTPARPHRSRWIYAVFVGLTTVGTFGAFTEWKLRPSISAAAEAVAVRAATDALNDAVTEEMARSTTYGHIVHMERDGHGDMYVTNFDFPSVIQVQTQATERAESHLRHLEEETFRVPLLQTLGGSLFSAYGPAIPVKAYLVGAAHSSIQAEQRTVGINQTVHMLYLDLSAQVHVVAPLVSKPAQIHSRVLLAYVILNGKVPNTYMAPGGGVGAIPFGNRTPEPNQGDP